jgi:hypothetical protein
VIVLLLHFSVAVSRLADQSKLLAQRLAMLEEKVGGPEGAGTFDTDQDRAQRMTQEVS